MAPRAELQDFARISSQSPERQMIDPAIECIGCGACLSACTMVHWRPEFPGSAALLRAFTLVADSRDATEAEGRLVGLLSQDGPWHCHTQFNCTAVCPMELNPTQAIENLKRRAVSTLLREFLKYLREKQITSLVSWTRYDGKALRPLRLYLTILSLGILRDSMQTT